MDYGDASIGHRLSQAALSGLLLKQQQGQQQTQNNANPFGLQPASARSPTLLRGISAEGALGSALAGGPPPFPAATAEHRNIQEQLEQTRLQRQLHLLTSGLSGGSAATSSLLGRGGASNLLPANLGGVDVAQIQQLLSSSAGGVRNNPTTAAALAAAISNSQARRSAALLRAMGMSGIDTGGGSTGLSALLGGSGGLPHTGGSQPNAAAISALLLQQQQQQQQESLMNAREQLLLSSMPSSNLGANFGNFSFPSGSDSPGGLALNMANLPRSRGGVGAPAAILREQGLTGPEDVTSLSESFPVKLHRLLLDLELQDGGTDVASFLPNGMAFVVHNPTRFEAEVMRKYFPRMNRFASFQRQLNLYDFRRITDGPARGAYYHPSFNRDFPVLCRGMKRTKIKGQVTKPEV